MSDHDVLVPLRLIIQFITAQPTLAQPILLRIMIILSSRDPILQFMPQRAALLLNGIFAGTTQYDTATQDELLQLCPLVSYLFLNYPTPMHASTEVWCLLRDVCTHADTAAQALSFNCGPIDPQVPTQPCHYDSYNNQYRLVY